MDRTVWSESEKNVLWKECAQSLGQRNHANGLPKLLSLEKRRHFLSLSFTVGTDFSLSESYMRLPGHES